MANSKVTKIPLLRVTDAYRGLKSQLISKIESIVDNGGFILGKEVEEFESKMSKFVGCTDTIGVSSGTDAIYLALKANGIGAGDYVVTSSFTFFATVSAIRMTGATPIFCDIDLETYNIDLDALEQILDTFKSKVKAIVPVHLYGLPCDMDRVSKLADERNLKVIEDCAQALGSKFKGKSVGTFGDGGSFSFFPSKNLGGMGDGGLVSTNSHELAAKVKQIRAHGSKKKYYHEVFGGNHRIDALQAGILNVILKNLESNLIERRSNAQFFNEQLSQFQNRLAIPEEPSDYFHTYHQYTLRIRDGKRDSFQEHLNRDGIASAIYYPVPCNLQEALKKEFPESAVSCPKSEIAAKEVISIPVFPGLTNEEKEHIVKSIAVWAKGSSQKRAA